MSSTATEIGSPTRKRQKTSVAPQTEELTTDVARAVVGIALDIAIDKKWDLPGMSLLHVNKEIRDQVEAAINSGKMSFSTFSKGQLTVLNDKTKQAFKYDPPQYGEAPRDFPPNIYFNNEEYSHNDTSDCIRNFKDNVAAPYNTLLSLIKVPHHTVDQHETFIINYLNNQYPLITEERNCFPEYTVFFCATS